VVVVSNDHDLDAVDAVEVPEFVRECPHAVTGSPTEQRFETPLPLVGVTRVENDVLVVVLDAVQFLDDLVVAVIEPEQCDDFAGGRLQPGVGLDVLLHRFPDRPRAIVQPFGLPYLIEFLEDLVGDVETRPHTDTRCGSHKNRPYVDPPDRVVTIVLQWLGGDPDSTMVIGEASGLFVGAVLLGAVHGIEPGHGWPVAASYALDRSNKWASGFAASLLLGTGHLVSSIAMVALFFYAKSYFSLTEVNEPIQVSANVVVGGPVSLVAGGLLIALGIREYTHGHSHDHGGSGAHPHADEHSHGHSDEHSHDHDDEHSHDHDDAHSHGQADAHSHGQADAHSHDHADAHSHGHSDAHSHDHADAHSHDHDALHTIGDDGVNENERDDVADRGLWGIAWFAFLLGFAHEEEFEIIALCAGSNHCLELMGVYALTVIGGIVTLTMVLVAGYQHFEERVERYTQYLPAVSAAVLVLMGLGFILNLF